MPTLSRNNKKIEYPTSIKPCLLLLIYNSNKKADHKPDSVTAIAGPYHLSRLVITY